MAVCGRSFAQPRSDCELCEVKRAELSDDMDDRLAISHRCHVDAVTIVGSVRMFDTELVKLKKELAEMNLKNRALESSLNRQTPLGYRQLEKENERLKAELQQCKELMAYKESLSAAIKVRQVKDSELEMDKRDLLANLTDVSDGNKKVFAHSSEIGNKMQFLSVQVDAYLVAVKMFQHDALSLRDFELIMSKRQHSRTEAAETLLRIVMEQPCQVYECFVAALEDCGLHHVVEELTGQNGEVDLTLRLAHVMKIRTNYEFLLKYVDTLHTRLLDNLVDAHVILGHEMDEIRAERTQTQQTQKLLALMTHKSAKQFQDFLDALDRSGQSYVTSSITGRRTA